MKKRACASLALVTAVLVAACGGGGGQGGGTSSSGVATGSSKPYPVLHWGFVSFPGAIDYLKNAGPCVAVEELAVQNLVDFETDGKVVPDLASSVQQPDLTTYVYRIRSGVRFSDGKPLTVADVVYSLKRNLLSKEAWTKTYWEDVASVASQGSSAVVVKLKRPSAVWPDILAFTSQIIEKAQAERVGEKALGTPGNLLIGTGPWKFDSYQPENAVQLSRNPYWKGPQPLASRIAISLFKDEPSLALALRSGAVAGTFGYTAPKTFANIAGFRQMGTPATWVAFFGMNTTMRPFNDVHVRRAIAYATDTKGMVNALYPSLASEAVTISPASLFGNVGSAGQVNEMLSSLPKYAFDLEAAKRELAKSADPHGFTTRIEAEASSSSQLLVAQILSSDLAKIGITAKIDEIQPDESSNVFGSRVTIDVSEYAAAYPDVEGLLSSLLLPSQIRPPGSGLNFANYRSPEVTRLMSEQVETLDPQRRLKLLGKLLRIVGEDVPYRPLYGHGTFGSVSDGYVFPPFSEWTAYYTPWALGVKLAHS